MFKCFALSLCKTNKCHMQLHQRQSLVTCKHTLVITVVTQIQNILTIPLGLGGWYSYRLSKSALNMANRNLSIELGRGRRKVICLALHPGTVDTDLSRPYHKNVPKDKLFTAEYSVSRLMDIINAATVSKSGNFYSWDGSQLPF